MLWKHKPFHRKRRKTLWFEAIAHKECRWGFIAHSKDFTENENLVSSPFLELNFYFLKKLWCCVGGRDQNKNLVLSDELIKVELPLTVKGLESWRFERQPFVRANTVIVGCCGLYESVDELCHCWKCGHMNLWINKWNERRSLIPRGESVPSWKMNFCSCPHV